jgi:uncharacterized protein (TIGR02001 family)
MAQGLAQVVRYGALGCATSLVLVAVANAQVTGNIALTSDYVSRGVSYSDNDPAVQGGFDWSHSSGVYAGIWGSNVRFGTPAHVELDVYGGVARKTARALGWDAGLAYYTYPGASQTNYGEVYGGVSYRSLSAKLWYANDYAGTGGDEVYLEGEVTVSLPHSVGLSLHAGYSAFDAQVGIEDYLDYKASLSRGYEGLTLDLSYTDTNKNQFGPWDDWRIVATVSKQL